MVAKEGADTTKQPKTKALKELRIFKPLKISLFLPIGTGVILDKSDYQIEN